MESYIAWEPKGVCYTHFGVCTASQLLSILNRVCVHPDFDRFAYLIDDLSFADTTQRCTGSLEALLAQALGAHYTNPSLMVFCATEDPLLRQLARLFRRDLHWDLQIVAHLTEASSCLAQRAAHGPAAARPAP